MEKKREKLIVNFDEYITDIPENDKKKIYNYKKDNPKEIRAFIPGVILKINVHIGDSIKKGDTLLVLEAMKMKNRIYAEFNGIISSIKVKEGDRVAKDELLLILE